MHVNAEKEANYCHFIRERQRMDFEILKDVRVAVAMISQSKKRANSGGQTGDRDDARK